MIFSLGNLIVLGIVIVILAIYRQLDKNNRTLDKVRKYSDKVKEELDGVIAEKVRNLKDLAIELEVHQKAAKEVLKRTQGLDDGMKEKFSTADALAARIKEYDKVLNELVQMTRRAEENINRIKEESEFTDNVAKKIRVVAGKLDEQEARIPDLVRQFQDKNDEALKVAEAAIVSHANDKIVQLESRIHSSEGKAQDLTVFLERAEQEGRERTEKLRLEFQGLGEELTGKVTDELAAVEAAYQEKLDDAARKGETLETKALLKLKEHIEEKLKAHSRELSAQIEEGKTEAVQRLDNLEREMAQDLEARTDGLRVDLERRFAEVQAYTQSSYDKIEELYAVQKEKTESWNVKMEETFQASEERLGLLGEGIEKAVRENTSRIAAHLEETRGSLAAQDQEIAERLDVIKTALEEAEAEGRKLGDQVLARCESIAQENEERIKAKLDEISAVVDKVETVNREVLTKIDGLKDSLFQETKALDAALRKAGQDYEGRIAKEGEALTHRVIGDLDERLQEYEKNITYRFARIEDITAEIDGLENSLKDLMERTTVRLREDFSNFGKDLHEKRLADKAELEAEMETLRGSMGELEKGLNELKTRAYENVSEKLKIFEDEFFQDLKARDDVMQAKFMDWQGRVDSSIDVLAKEALEERRRIETQYVEDLRAKMAESQGRVDQHLDRSEKQTEEFRKNLTSRIEGAESSLTAFQSNIRQDLEETKKVTAESIREELLRYGKVMGGELEKFEKTFDQRLKGLTEGFDEGKREFSELFEDLKSEVTLWQTRLVQDFKTSETEVTNQFAGFKVQVSGTISSLREEFSTQKNDLITATNEERKRLKEELRSISDSVATLEENLRKKTDESFDEFEKKNLDLQAEADQKIRDFRSLLQDTGEQFEGLSQKLFSRVEDGCKVLGVNLAEIEKRQKSFVEQTKIFERADALKTSLERNIEDLKEEMTKVDAQRKDLKETELQFLKIRKLGEEIGEKMNRFIADKRRIDTLEEDYKRLIGMSEAVEKKLQQVTSTDDSLQAIQASFRSLETLQQEVDARFERLEKKRKILDVTTEGVDRNFQVLGDLEKRFSGVAKELEILPERIDSLSQKFKTLASGKDQADQAMKLLSGIDAAMKDLEGRMGHLQKTREWLARTETRMEEITREAQDQVKLLGSLLKEGAKTGPKKEKGAPSLSARETVQKLAHQGWTVEQIAMTTKLSRGEVELILELSTK